MGTVYGLIAVVMRWTRSAETRRGNNNVRKDFSLFFRVRKSPTVFNFRYAIDASRRCEMYYRQIFITRGKN